MEAMRDAELSPAELARELKLSYQAVSKVLKGNQFGMANNLKAARRLGVRSEWLASGKGPKLDPTSQVRPEAQEIADAFDKLSEDQIKWAMRGIRFALEAAALRGSTTANAAQRDDGEKVKFPSSRGMR